MPRNLPIGNGSLLVCFVKEDPPLHVLPPRVRQVYGRGLPVLRTQIDWGGGIVSANDSDVIALNRDTYAYVWPRGGALVAHALGLAGYPVPARKFFDFMAQRMEKESYCLHKYNPDGTLASSWHPWYLIRAKLGWLAPHGNDTEETTAWKNPRIGMILLLL